jgi:Holliday junction resolvase
VSGRSSRTKGARGEREVRDIFKAHGFLGVERTPNSGGLWLPGDLTGLDEHGVHVEVKRAERIELSKWIAQAEADCPAGSVPLLAFRRSREPWRAVAPLPWLVGLIANTARGS